jgi:WD40 repeat protein/tetratricopeptide (TPR) repeat protein
VYFDLMDRARKSLADVLYELAATIAQELNLAHPARAEFDDEGFAFHKRFLPIVYAALGEERRLVLLLDEFDVLDVSLEERLPITAAAREFFPYLRGLMTNEPRLAFVFVVGRKAEELGIEFKAAFKASRYARVSVLDEQAAQALILRAETEGTLHFAPDAVKRVVALTACHPYLAQLTCQLLFEKAYQNPDITNTPTITITDVEAGIPKVLEACENVFEWIWDGLPPAERVIFSAVASGTDEQTIVTEERLLNILQSQGIRILIRELELAPKTLVEWQMLKEADGGYKFFVELMRRWVVERKPLAKVKDELDRIVPLADTLYQGAQGFFRRTMTDSAITQLVNALTVNPNHLKARLLLGEIYRGQGKFDQAVRELEEAYRIDADAGRIPLENLLLQRADALEKQNQTDTAFETFTRILAISPSNRIAQERHTAIEAQKRKRTAEELAGSVKNLERREQWEQAVSAYQHLVELDPDDERWRDALTRVQAEWQIARRYAEGLGAMQQKKWAEAQRAFADVIHLRPDYKLAADNLAQVTRQLRRTPPQPERKPTIPEPLLRQVSDSEQMPVPPLAKTRSKFSRLRWVVGIVGVALVVIIFWAWSWDYVLKPIVAPTPPPRPDSVIDLAFSPDGRSLASAYSFGSVQIWNVANGTVAGTLPNRNRIVFSPDGSLLAYASSGQIDLDRWSDNVRVRSMKAITSTITALAIRPDGSQIAAGASDKNVYVWQVSDGSLVNTLTGHTESVKSVAYSPDGKMIASGSDDKTIRLWSVVDGTLSKKWVADSGSVRSIAFNPDGRQVVTGGNNLQLWNITGSTAEGILVNKLSSSGSVSSIAFSPDGTLVAAAVEYRVDVWNIANTSRVYQVTHPFRILPASFFQTTSEVVAISRVAFSPDGKTLASGGNDGKIYLWNASDGSVIRALTK